MYFSPREAVGEKTRKKDIMHFLSPAERGGERENKETRNTSILSV